jgi:hypothetical protein
MLGKSNREGSWRIYFSPALNEYVEVAEDDIVYTHDLPDPEIGFDLTLIAVRSGASVRHTQVSSQTMQAEFLSGTIAAALEQPLVTEEFQTLGFAHAPRTTTACIRVTLSLCPPIASAAGLCPTKDWCTDGCPRPTPHTSHWACNPPDTRGCPTESAGACPTRYPRC